MPRFDIDRFLELSGAVQMDDLDWDEIARIGVTDAEERMLRYMGDTETHTILYMRDLLAGYTARDPEITSFLSVWVFEELWHGRAIERLLTAAGRPASVDRYAQVTGRASMRETIEAALSWAAAWTTPRFIAAHMTWGAINELTAAAAYMALARHTKNPGLAELLTRLAKQERKHFSFYFHQAQQRMVGEPRTQWLVRWVIKNWWSVVGSGVGGDDNLAFLATQLFSDETGRRTLHDAEATIRELPGMEWFDMVTGQVFAMIDRYVRETGTGAGPSEEPRSPIAA